MLVLAMEFSRDELSGAEDPAGQGPAGSWVTAFAEGSLPQNGTEESDAFPRAAGGQVLRQPIEQRRRVVRASTGNLPERMSDKDSLERR
jgi:hypothetical protein